MAASRARFWKRIGVAAVVLLLAGWGGFHLLIRSDWFEEQLRLRVIAEIERATGGVVELQALRFDPEAMTVELTGLDVRSSAGSEPFIELPSTALGLTVESLLAARVRLDSLRLEDPTVRLTISEDGSTNWPSRAAETEALDLADIGLGRFEIARGKFFFNGEAHDVNAAAENVALSAQLDANRCYSASMQAEDVQAGVEQRTLNGVISSAVRLCGDRLTIERLEASTDSYGTWRASGSAAPISAPAVSLDYSFEAPIESLLTGLPDGWRLSGPAAGSGSLTRDAEGAVAYNGDVTVSSLVLRGPAGSLTDSALDVWFSGDLDAVSAPTLELRLPTGTVAGSAAVADLRGQPSLTSQGELHDVRVGRLIRLATARFPWAGSASGSYSLAASADRGFSASSTLSFVDPGDASRPGMFGDVSAAYASQDGELSVDRLDLTAQGIELSANGSLSEARSSRLQFSVSAAQQRDVETLLAMAGYSEPLPATFAGPVFATGVLSTASGLPTIEAAHVEARVSTGAIEAHDNSSDSDEADIVLDQGSLAVSNGRLVDGSGSVALSGTAEIARETPPAEWPFRAHADASGLSVPKIAAAAGLGWDVDGAVDASAELEGPAEQFHLSGDLRLRDASVSAQHFDSLTAAVDYQSGRVRVSAMELRRGEAALIGQGTYALAERAFSLEVQGSDLNIADLPYLGDRPEPVRGALSFNVTSSGVLGADPDDFGFDALVLDGTWRVAGLQFAGASFGDWSGDASDAGDRINLTLSGTPLDGTVTGSASVGSGILDFAADLRFADLNIGGLLDEGNGASTGPSGAATGEAQFQGSLRSLSEVQGEGVFSELRLEIADVPSAEGSYALYNPFPMRWTFSDGSLRLDHMRLQGEGTNLQLTGAVGLASGVDSDLAVEGDFNLAALQQFQPGWTAAGRSTIGIRLTGSLADPEIQGQWSIRDGLIQPEEGPLGLSNVNGSVMFVGREFRIQEMRAASGGGVLTLTGGGRVAANDYEFRVDGAARNVRVRYPEGVNSVIDGDFVFSGGGAQRLLSGEVVIERLSTARTTTLGTLLSALQSGTPTAAQADPTDSVQLNVHIASAPGVEINTSLIRNVAASIDMRIVGTAGNPSLLGQINIAQGQMTFHGSRYRINRGEIEFRNPVRIEPLLDFELETRMRGVDIALILAGPARRLNVSYRSDPPLSFSDLVTLVAVGRDPTTDPLSVSRQRIEQQSLFQTGANNVLAQAVQAPVSPGLQRFFGVSRLKVDPAVGGAEANPAARISTEQQLTDDITLIYTFDLSSSQQQTARLEWTPDRRWTFVVTRDENGLVGSDAIYKLRRD